MSGSIRRSRISPGSRITAIIDAHDIMINGKCYKKKMTKKEAIVELKNYCSIQFLNFGSKIIDDNNYYQPKVFEKDGNIYIFIKHFQYGRQKTRVDFVITELESNKVEDFYVNSSYLATLKVSAFRSMAKNSGFKNIELLVTGGKVRFEPKKHIRLYALMSREEK